MKKILNLCLMGLISPHITHGAINNSSINSSNKVFCYTQNRLLNAKISKNTRSIEKIIKQKVLKKFLGEAFDLYDQLDKTEKLSLGIQIFIQMYLPNPCTGIYFDSIPPRMPIFNTVSIIKKIAKTNRELRQQKKYRYGFDPRTGYGAIYIQEGANLINFIESCFFLTNSEFINVDRITLRNYLIIAIKKLLLKEPELVTPDLNL